MSSESPGKVTSLRHRVARSASNESCCEPDRRWKFFWSWPFGGCGSSNRNGLSRRRMPFQVAGEHAQEHMSAYMRFAVDINGLHLQPGGLDGAKGALDCGQTFVSCHCVMGVDGISRQRGSDHIDAIELSLVVDSLLISHHSRSPLVTVMSKCFSTLRRLASRPSRLMVRSRLAEFDL